MSEKIQLLALSRNSDQADKKKNYILAEVYGPGVENKHIMVESVAFQKVFHQAAVSSLIDLQIDGKETVQVIVRDTQTDPLKSNLIHVDFYQVDPNKKLIAKVNLVTVGASLAVQNLGGILVKNMDTLEIECLPSNLVGEIDIDISTLATFKDVIRVADIQAPENTIIKNNPRDIVMSVVAARKQVAVGEAGAPVEEAPAETPAEAPAEEEKKEE